MGIDEKLKKCFEGRDDILLAFVFGSAAAGRLTAESDVDVAVLFTIQPQYANVLELRERISELTNRSADIVVLNNSSPIIRMQVLKHGILVHCVNEAEYRNFIVRTVKEYDDLKYLRREAEANIQKGRIYA